MNRLLVLFAALGAAAAASAQPLINVKIRNGSSPASDAVFQASSSAVLGTATDYWNGFNYQSSTPNNASLVDSANNLLSGVTLTVSNSSGVGGGTASGSVQLSPSINLGLYAYQNAGGIFTITLNGLVANQQYEFVGYAAEPVTDPDSGANWAVTTGSLLSGSTSNTGASASLTGGLGISYVDMFVQTDATGKLSITDTNLAGASRTILQGFQLQQSTSAVPEPATYAIWAGLGALGLVVWKRRQSAVATAS